jgi:predicted YcjX-like family ATPase
MSLLNWVTTTEARVGVVGFANSGKTVLVTALIDHLMHHDPHRFKLGAKKDATLRRFRELPPDDGWAKFNFEAHRDALVHQSKWPRKTRDRSQYVCRFDRSDWTFSDCLLKLYDLPGERIADAAMLKMTFAEWSAHRLKQIEDDTTYRAHCAEYLAAIRAPGATEADLLAAYRLAQARLVLSYKPLITPSTFLLDTQGTVARNGTPEELAKARHCGADAENQFCPLPADRCVPGDPLFAAFEAGYSRYQREVVAPAIAGFLDCTTLVVLTDVTMLLAGGAGYYNDSLQVTRELFNVLKPGENWFEWFERMSLKALMPRALWRNWVTRVAFVAPKIDLVHPDDRDRVPHLLARMLARLAHDCTGLKHQFFNVSAVSSTRALPAEGDVRPMTGMLLRGPDGRVQPRGAEMRYTVSVPPHDWPQEWPADVYRFPEVYPRVQVRRDYPPDHLGLDDLATFVIE